MTDADFQVTYFGVLRACTSWAKVGRELSAALLRGGADVNIYERKGFLYRSDYELPAGLETCITGRFRDDVVWTFEHPQVYRYLQGRLKVGLLTYESTVAPPHWVSLAKKHLDLLLVPSTFCREIFSSAGFPDHRMAVVPYGFDPEIFTPEGPRTDAPFCPERRLRFLTVASPHRREGLEQVLSAFAEAFSAADDVSLLIKLNYTPGEKTKPFEYRDVEDLLTPFQGDPGLPPVSVTSDYFTEPEMAALYRGASCLVSATRGEGFGLVFLESLAVGLPVIVTGWSGHMDFLHDENASLVGYTLKPAREMQYDCQSREALLAEPDVADLARRMRFAYDRPSEMPQSTNPGALVPFSWPAIARQFREIVSERL